MDIYCVYWFWYWIILYHIQLSTFYLHEINKTVSSKKRLKNYFKKKNLKSDKKMYNKNCCKSLSLESLAVHISHYKRKLKSLLWKSYFEILCLTKYIDCCKEIFIQKFCKKFRYCTCLHAAEFINCWLNGTHNEFPHL